MKLVRNREVANHFGRKTIVENMTVVVHDGIDVSEFRI